MATLRYPEDQLNLETGYLCLDFANTAEWHASDSPDESLNSYHDLIEWARGAGVLSARTAERLGQAAAERQVEANAVLDRAIGLRETIYRIFSAIAHKNSPAAVDLAKLNTFLSEIWQHQVVIEADAGFVWAWTGAESRLDQMLWPVIRSTVDLLTSNRLDRVRQCADDRGCGYLFWDTSRNRSRKWCDMESCGNRAKAQRHYKRARAASAQSE